MTPEEIRKLATDSGANVMNGLIHQGFEETFFLAEIAAQLAEHNELLREQLVQGKRAMELAEEGAAISRKVMEDI